VTDLLQGGYALASGEDRVLCRWLGLNFLLDVFMYSFVTMYSGVTQLWFVSPAKGWPKFHLSLIF
jgi:hypothetical protein